MNVLDRWFYYVYCGIPPKYIRGRFNSAVTFFALGVEILIGDILLLIRLYYQLNISSFKYFQAVLAGAILSGFIAITYYFNAGGRAEKIVRNTVLEKGPATMADRVTGFVISLVPFIIFFLMASKIYKANF